MTGLVEGLWSSIDWCFMTQGDPNKTTKHSYSQAVNDVPKLMVFLTYVFDLL